MDGHAIWSENAIECEAATGGRDAGLDLFAEQSLNELALCVWHASAVSIIKQARVTKYKPVAWTLELRVMCASLRREMRIGPSLGCFCAWGYTCFSTYCMALRQSS
jgi:hypothetical protein